MSDQSRVTRCSANRLEIVLTGRLTEEIVAATAAEARAQLSVAKPGMVALVVDMCGLSDASLSARDALVVLQQALATKLRQTAYVADSPAGRGLSLWVRHTVQDQVIKAFPRREEALDWLAADPGPTTGVRPVERSRRPTPLLRPRRAIG